MAVGEQERGGVPVAPTIGFRRLDQPIDFTLGQVLARAGRSDCYIYCSRSALLDVRISMTFAPSYRTTVTILEKCNSKSTRMGLVGASILRPAVPTRILNETGEGRWLRAEDERRRTHGAWDLVQR